MWRLYKDLPISFIHNIWRYCLYSHRQLKFCQSSFLVCYFSFCKLEDIFFSSEICLWLKLAFESTLRLNLASEYSSPHNYCFLQIYILICKQASIWLCSCSLCCSLCRCHVQKTWSNLGQFVTQSVKWIHVKRRTSCEFHYVLTERVMATTFNVVYTRLLLKKTRHLEAGCMSNDLHSIYVLARSLRIT